MLANILLIALVASPLVSAHGKVSVVTGDAGGNGTALGIKGAVVPGAGSNSKTEVDTTVFGSTKIATNGLGETTGSGQNKVSMAASAMAASGSTLPQVFDGGNLTGTLHVVTTDGAGPFQAIVDSTGTGAFATGTKATVTQQVPGNNGNIKADGTVPKVKRWTSAIMKRAGLMKRAANVNKDFPFTVQIPAGTTCTGTVAGQANTCLVKIANSNPAGPFGGVVAIQMAGASTSTTTNTTSAVASTKKASKFSA